MLPEYTTNQSLDVDDVEEKEKTTSRSEKFERIVEFSPEMSAYREELRKVLHTLDTVGARGLIFDTVLLVAIDDGWGFSELVEMISYELKVAFDLQHTIIYKAKEKYITDKREGSWSRQQDKIEQLSDRANRGERFAVLTYDLSDAMPQFGTPEFMQNICEIKRRAKDVVIIFRIPYVNHKTLQTYEQMFDDVMSVRTLAIPPVSVENMVTYLREKIHKMGIKTEDECDDLLEQWICQEKSEGVFRGYQTLDKMVTELFYQKALNADSEDTECDMSLVDSEDIQKMLNYPMETGDAYQLLNNLIGMAQLKKSIKEMVAQIQFQKQMEESGKEVDRPSLHMMFLGNPGTGKTTVARIIGRIFRQEGLLRKGHFIETTGNGLVIGNIQATMEHVRNLCRDSYGSILFIDEAYGMNIGHSSGNVADEILPTLVAEMENHRDDMCVILAGYKEEMEEFVKENSGLKSRIPHVLEFPNYTREELIEIFFKMIDGKFEYERELKDTVCEYFLNIPDENLNDREFSNARFVRNLYERLWGKAAYRISQSQDKRLLLKKEDMVCITEEEDFHTMVKEKNKKQIGFTFE